jgi:hypothetical protein
MIKFLFPQESRKNRGRKNQFGYYSGSKGYNDMKRREGY